MSTDAKKIWKNIPDIAIPPAPPLFQSIAKLFIFNMLFLIGFPYFCYLIITKWSVMYDILHKAIQKSIIHTKDYQSDELITEVWNLPVAQQYRDAVEYQRREGYCCPTTQRCILKSIPSIKTEDLPIMKGGPASIDKYCSIVDKIGNGQLSSTVIYGDDKYQSFIETLKKVNDPKYRIAINFLRSSLFGMKSPLWLPSNLLLSIFGGHFSPIIGYLEKEDLVAVFDVNHNYGLFLVKSERLYDSISTFDLSSGKSRGIVITTIH